MKAYPDLSALALAIFLEAWFQLWKSEESHLERLAFMARPDEQPWLAWCR